MSNPLQEAREFQDRIEEIHSKHDGCICDYCEIETLLPALIDYAEQWQARCIAERAELLRNQEIENYGSLSSDDINDYLLQAARELEAEAGSWRKIGPDEVAAIELAIDIIDQSADSLEEEMAMKVLRKLREGLP